MTNWIQAYGQLAGVALGGLLAGGVALVVGRMNNKASDARLAHQIAHEREREERRLCRERREELYVSLETWLANIDQYILLGLRLAAGKLNYQQLRDLQLEQGKNSKLDAPRLKMLLDVYGNAAIRQEYLKVTDIRSAINQEMFAVEKLAEGSKSINKYDRSFASLNRLAGELRSDGKALLASVAAAITSERTRP